MIVQEIIVDEEFKSLLPVLDKETFTMLEENLLEHGCRDALVLWEGILIDGYNRYAICIKHEIPFSTVSKEFKSREEVLIWIISNQVSRRNLTSMQLSHFRGLHYRADKKLIKNAGGKNQFSEVSGHNDHKANSQSTATRLSGQYRVSPKTIRRDSRVSEAIDAIGAISPETKSKILSGEISIDKKALEKLLSEPVDELAELIASVEDGSYERKRGSAVADKDAPVEADRHPSSDNNGIHPLEAAVIKTTDELLAELRRQRAKGDMVDMKVALRTCIDKLEVLYKQYK